MRSAPRVSPIGSHESFVLQSAGHALARRGALVAPLLLATCLAGCAGSSSAPSFSSSSSDTFDSKWGVSSSRRVVDNGPIPKGGGHYKLGRPYQIGGKWYVPRHEPYYDRTGVGSWYGQDFHGRKTANGEVYDMNALTAAHPTLPMPSYAYVTNMRNGRTILVRINDRGPYVANREIDLSRAAARALGYEQGGLGKVRVRWAGHAPLNGDDRREQAFLRNQPWNGGPVARFDRPVPPQDDRRYREPQPRYAEDGGRRADFAYDAPPPRQAPDRYRNDGYRDDDRRPQPRLADTLDDGPPPGFGQEPYPQPRGRREAFETSSNQRRDDDEAMPQSGEQWSPFSHREQLKRR